MYLIHEFILSIVCSALFLCSNHYYKKVEESECELESDMTDFVWVQAEGEKKITVGLLNCLQFIQSSIADFWQL